MIRVLFDNYGKLHLSWLAEGFIQRFAKHLMYYGCTKTHKRKSL